MAIKKSDLYSSLWASCDQLRGGMDARRVAVHKVLAANGHAQARAQIELAHAELMPQVQGLAEPADRERVLSAVKLHREIAQRRSDGGAA